MKKLFVAAVAAAVLLAPAPAWAHGVGGRADLPLPLWLVSYAAAGVLVVTFAALAWLWPRSLLEGRTPGVELGGTSARVIGGLRRPLQAAGVLVFFVVWTAALFGNPNSARNLATRAVFVVVWVGFTFASGLVGDLWSATGPIAWVWAAFGRRARNAYRLGRWPAVVLFGAFTWFELVYPDPSSPRAIGLAITVYVVIVVAGAARWGRPWLAEGEPFGAYFGMLGHMAPLARVRGTIRIRPPLVGLASMPVRRGTTALVIAALGTTTFDGLSRTRLWGSFLGEARGWSAALLNSFGLIWTIAFVALIYTAACAAIPLLAQEALKGISVGELADRFAHSLVPVALGYAVAHYFSLLVFEGNWFLAQLSDPFDRGWDLLGTATWLTNFSIVSSSAIAWVQVGAIIAGHIGGVILAHDRAVALVSGRRATATQYPLLAAMVAFTVGGLVLLLGS